MVKGRRTSTSGSGGKHPPGTLEQTKRSLSRADWCQKALEWLVAEGSEGLKVSRIADALGVTYGSFYHHFQSADQFQQQILVYWHKEIIVRIAQEHLATSEPSLESLMATLAERGYPRYDAAIRLWAESYPPARKAINKADAYRARMMARMFEKRGFSAQEAKARGRLMITVGIGRLVAGDQTSGDELIADFVKLADSK